jgi:hypothetical protein
MDAKQVLVATMLATMGASAFGQQAREPYVRVAEIDIDSSQLEAYKAAVKEQIEAAVRLEPGFWLCILSPTRTIPPTSSCSRCMRTRRLTRRTSRRLISRSTRSPLRTW